MVVPYNLLPIELHRDMVQAEQAKVPLKEVYAAAIKSRA